jgi:AcrR family transcriptional regulator
MVSTVPYSTAMALSRGDWTEAALEALGREGLQAVAIDPLARALGATKGSFYWHFKGHDDLVAAVLERWEERDTTAFARAIEQIPDPRERLVWLARSAFAGAARGNDPHAALVAAAADPRVAGVLARVTATRLTVLEQLYCDAGVTRPRAERHARLTYAMYTGMGDLLRAVPAAAPRAAAEIDADIELMVDMLVRAALDGG